MGLLRVLLGRPLSSEEQEERRIGAVAGVPALGLDGLASSSYGPEAALTILLPLGALGLHVIGPVMLAIMGLLLLLFLSYRQTIGAYPGGGGAFTVARENLGTTPSLLAAAALMIDYVLNAAVGISAGVGALVSAVPALHDWMLPLCLAVLFVVMIVNLRGTLESGWAFALPTYVFVACMALVLGAGLVRTAWAGGHPVPVEPAPALGPPQQALTAWLVLAAFASGCTAMTGVEAVSNGVTAFKEPPVRHARRTLAAIVAILGSLLGGIAILCRAYDVGAMDQTRAGYQSVVSQLVGSVWGRGAIYYVTMASVLAVLALSANTSFVGFPRLCRAMARDRWLPDAFALEGRRLVHTAGILFLSGCAALLIVAFGGITDRLIPLFAVGAFLAFTFSQVGMVAHGWRERREGRGGLLPVLVNAVGATATSVALGIVLVAKFTHGAWVTLVALPLLVLLFRAVRRHYDLVERQLHDPTPLVLGPQVPPAVVLPIHAWNRLADRALHVALRMSPHVYVLHLVDPGDPDAIRAAEALRRQWVELVERPTSSVGLPHPPLLVVPTPYRRLREPLVAQLDALRRRHPGREVAVVLPELVKTHWWQYLLHKNRGWRLRAQLLRHGGPGILVVNVPWVLESSSR